MNGSLLAAFMTEVALVTYRNYAGSGVAGGGVQVPGQAPLNLPLPADYTAPVVAYGVLAVFPPSASTVAGAIGWGLVVATLLNLWDPAGKVKPVAAQVPGGPVAGQSPTQVPQGQGGDFTRQQAPNFMGPLPSS